METRENNRASPRSLPSKLAGDERMRDQGRKGRLRPVQTRNGERDSLPMTPQPAEPQSGNARSAFLPTRDTTPTPPSCAARRAAFGQERMASILKKHTSRDECFVPRPSPSTLHRSNRTRQFDITWSGSYLHRPRSPGSLIRKPTSC